jgi:DUF971 family protein
MAAVAKAPRTIKELSQIGRYAVGVKWSDGHESIYPLENLRRYCPCRSCGGAMERLIAHEAQRLAQLVRLGDVSVFLSWHDGHETIYTNEQLRSICRCAYCAGEPDRPITGG